MNKDFQKAYLMSMSFLIGGLLALLSPQFFAFFALWLFVYGLVIGMKSYKNKMQLTRKDDTNRNR